MDRVEKLTPERKETVVDERVEWAATLLILVGLGLVLVSMILQAIGTL